MKIRTDADEAVFVDLMGNPRPVALAGGVVTFDVGRYIGSLVLRGATKAEAIANPPLPTPEALKIRVADGEFVSFDVATPDEKTLVVTAGRADGTRLVVTFEESRILIDFGLTAELAWATAELRFRGAGEFFSKLDFPPGEIRMEFDGCRYGIRYEGDLKPSQNGWTLHPIRGRCMDKGHGVHFDKGHG